MNSRIKAVVFMLSILTIPVVRAQLVVYDAVNFNSNLGYYLDSLREVLEQGQVMDEQLENTFDTLSVAQENLQHVLYAAAHLQNLAGYVEDRDLRRMYRATTGVLWRMEQMGMDVEAIDRAVRDVYGIGVRLPGYDQMYSTLRNDAAEERRRQAYAAAEARAARIRNQSVGLAATRHETMRRRNEIDRLTGEMENLGDLENPQLAAQELGLLQQSLVMRQNEQLIEQKELDRAVKLEEEAAALKLELQILEARNKVEQFWDW